MRLLLIGDTHSAWDVLGKIVFIEKPDLLVHCGDWSTARLIDAEKFKVFVEKTKIPVVGVYGNHDNIDVVMNLKAKNYTWLPSFIPRKVRGLTFLGINGNVAGRARHPWHITEEIIREELRLCNAKRSTVDFIVSHECPRGYADIIKRGTRDSKGRRMWRKNRGWQSLFEVLDKLRPKFWICGHIHFPQVAQYEETSIFNVGYGAKGNYMLLDTTKNYKEGYTFLSLFRKLKEVKQDE